MEIGTIDLGEVAIIIAIAAGVIAVSWQIRAWSNRFDDKLDAQRADFQQALAAQREDTDRLIEQRRVEFQQAMEAQRAETDRLVEQRRVEFQQAMGVQRAETDRLVEQRRVEFQQAMEAQRAETRQLVETLGRRVSDVELEQARQDALNSLIREQSHTHESAAD